MSRLGRILDRLERVLELAERWLRDRLALAPDARSFERHHAFRFEMQEGRGRLVPVTSPSEFDLDDLVGVDKSVKRLVRNTEQFLEGLPANHVLLYGERGTGKSSAVRGLLTRFSDRGLRIIEVRKSELARLPQLLELVRDAPFHFLLFCDDLSFSEGETGYRELKAALEGSLEGTPQNLRIIATSNRRHLLPEKRSDNRDVRVSEDGELHLGEALEEKLALSDRFGLVLAFYGFDQETYLEIVWRHLRKAGIDPAGPDHESLRAEALRWALDRSSRSGRTAAQFVADWVGQRALEAGA